MSKEWVLCTSAQHEWNRIPIKEMEKKVEVQVIPPKMIMIILIREGHRSNEFLHNIFQQSKGASSLEVMNWRRLHLYSFNATRFDSSSTAAPSSACLLLLGTWKIRKDDHSHQQPPKAAIIMTFAILLIYFILVPPSDHSQTCFSILTLLLNRIFHNPHHTKKIYVDLIFGRLSDYLFEHTCILWYGDL